MDPKVFRHYMRDNHGPELNSNKLFKALDRSKRAGPKIDMAEVADPGKAGTYGGLHEILNDNVREKVFAEPRDTAFKEDHAVYVLPGFLVDEDSQTINYLMATEHMLLQLWENAESGWDSVLCVDCTHRLVSQGHACIVFGTRSMDQKFHAVAYGILSSKSEEIHAYSMLMLKVEAEAVVARRKLTE